jgi:ribosome assembly protein RRB1
MFEGDCNNNIYLWEPTSAATWNVEKTPFTGHTASVEDLQVCARVQSNSLCSGFD